MKDGRIEPKVSSRRKWLRIVLLSIASILVLRLGANFIIKNWERKRTTEDIFWATYMTKKLCRSVGGADASQGDAAVGRFSNAYPEVMRLVSESPYLPVSKDYFERFINDNQTENENVTAQEVGQSHQSCQGGITVLSVFS